MDQNRLIRASGIEDKNIFSIFPYGSRVYGTDHERSDYDFVIINSDVNGKEIRNGDLNLHLHTVEHFQSLLNRHKVMALECFSLPPNGVIRNNVNFKFTLNTSVLFDEFTTKAEDSFRRGKILLEDKNGYADYFGRKSIWHSIRILMFGTQIIKHGRIIDYSCANSLHHDIFINDVDLEYYQFTLDQYGREFMSLMPTAI